MTGPPLHCRACVCALAQLWLEGFFFRLGRVLKFCFGSSFSILVLSDGLSFKDLGRQDGPIYMLALASCLFNHLPRPVGSSVRRPSAHEEN